ncbi:uncharacterized membrane protein HdeD (DUF308 family) [Streptomyces sp. SAI-208]|jgi:uncharacterized membrane protein HdeD (DUF308 family)|uniref:DUF308 domain-containing protein n=1 Tax=unclassified Streptomyces TaxID=2593676 RepID=UPI0024742A04|nr:MULTISPECIES: DUF308 domain-containing protein [unclassified Streptomyces]MDH6514404.1 uncharacterized membrane protein HdeD (DUF308 family) [Streptomyces sp. SAI-090]MDH6546584.1 uncharacterized membrane protein HdeD (DUF308 family) [Streptomyces sp. SAI-041]MDH6565687.1 uncharacterized membrane protein HdeD (DUF308 family) [Streptomyces sp. SAI-117]MDH6589396.1 uncharacterized membrane protein HdeD (DUF308 family) [Streptomyces sp. SAI-133]MDH6605246.1 uncharacterized membrane protein Hde
MTQTTITSPASTTSTTNPSGLRSLHLIRVAFSLIWVALVLTTSASLVSADRPTVIAAVLLIVYPLWDVIATLLERRLAGTGSTDRVSAVNLALGLTTTAAMVVAAFSVVRTSLLVFGVWALLSGAVQLVVAVRRRRSVGAQWPMMISGAQSVLAGATIAAGSASETSSLSTVAGYSAFGAFWFLVSVIALSVRGRREQR